MYFGYFNFSLRPHWDDGGEDWLIRFPLPGKFMFLDDKVCREAILMKFISENKQIPVPRVVRYGKAKDNPSGLGPFLIMAWIEGK
jgi:aminoglycoside phosphotransferase (APT) family kinase protein